MPYIGQRPSKGDENNFKILDDISSYTLTFDGSDSSVVSVANDTITSLNHRFVQGQRVLYHHGGGGSNIGGLGNNTPYFVIKEDHNTIKLATTASNASNGVAINITGVGGGSSHTLNIAFDGVNTKFKATHTNGQKANITRSAQLVISINGVIQQPHDSATPSTGFGFDLDGTIVFSQAPVVGDIYWAHVLTNNNVTFDISDNDVDNFTGNGSTVSFNLSKTPPDNRNVLVTIDGVVQYPNDPDGTVRAYTVVENVLTFTTAPDANVQIQVRHIGFAGSTSSGGSGVTNFYGRTGSVVLKNTDNIVANDAEFAGNLTVQGTMTTLDTKVTEVDQLEVAANNTTVGVAITQSGSGDILKLYDGSSEVFTVATQGDGVGAVTISSPKPRIVFNETNASPDYQIRMNGGNFSIHDSTNDIGRFSISPTRTDINNPVLINNDILYIGDKLVHWTDDDTAIRFPADNTISFETGGTQAVKIDSNQRLIIATGGTGNASVYADDIFISGSGPRGITIHTTSTSGSRPGCLFFGEGTSVSDMASGVILFEHSGNYMHFSSAGSVNVGKSIRLNSDGTVRFDSTPTDANSQSLLIKSLKARAVNDRNGINFRDAVDHTQASIYVEKKSTSNSQSDLVFRTSDGSNNVTNTLVGGGERLRITAAGKVGLNQSGPYADVDITSSVEDADNGTLAAHGIRLAHVGATDEEVIPITASFRTQQDRARAGIGFISKVSGSSEGYAGAIGFYTRNTADGNGLYRTDERLRIDSDGFVGIGTNNPDRMLHIRGTGNALLKMEGDYSGSVTGIEGVLTASGANRYVTGVYGKVVNTSGTESNVANIRLWNQQASPTTSDSPGYITFSTTNDGANSATEKVRITSAGAVGIGTDTPNGDLQIRAGQNASFRVLADPSTSGLFVGNYGSGDGYRSLSLLGSEIRLHTITAGALSGAEQRVLITPIGNVGIATDLSGGGGAYGRLSVVIPSQSGGSALQVMNSAAGSGDGSLTNIVLRSVNNAGTQWAGAEYRAQEHIFKNQATEALRIDSTGQVSIGGDTSVGTKLHIENDSGDAHIRLRGSVNYGVLFTRHSDGALTGFVGSGGAVNLGSSNLGITASLSGGDIVFQTGGTASSNERVRITSTGEVKVNGDGSGGGYLRIVKDRDTAYSSSGGNNQDLIIQQISDATNTGGYSSLALQCNYTGQTGAWVAINAVRTAVGEADLTINPRNNSNGDIERVRISAKGVVTISNASPPATGAMTFISNQGSATTLGTAATLRVANNGGNANYSVFEAESSSGCFRLTNSGRVFIGHAGFGNPDAILHVVGSSSAGVVPIAQFGKTTEGRYARFNSINNQQNFDHLLLRRYDNFTADVLRLQNTFANSAGYGTGLGFYGYGGNKTGGIKVVNRIANSNTARMFFDVSGTNIMHLEHSPNRVMIGDPPSAGGFLSNCPNITLQVRPSQNNTSPFACASRSYSTNYGLLPWAGGGTYISSGITYNNGNWLHESHDSTNCLFYMRGNGWYWYSSNNSTGSWNVFNGGQIMSSTGVWTGGTSSDRRLKDNITNMSTSDALTKVTQLQGVSYTWKDEIQKKYGTGLYPEGTHYGFIAQDVKTVWPEAHIISDVDNESDFDDDPTTDVKDDVYYGEIEGVKLEKMVPLLVEAIKELKKENDALKARITTLEG